MRYRILGVTRAEDGRGTAVPVGGPRLRALLTALALRPGATVTPRTLIDEVWPDDPPRDAPAALQALVGRLRRALGRDAVASEPGGYRLTATEDDVDLFVFERRLRDGTAALARGDAATAAEQLTAALSLWRGPALAELPDRTAAARPEALRLEAARARAEALLRLGRAQEAVPELTELTAAHPYDEPLHALLVRALRDTGRGADALAAYETARRRLAEGLGTDPGPELRALHTELLTRPADPHPAPPRPGQPSPPSPSPSSSSSPSLSPIPESSPAAPPSPPPPPPPSRTGNLRPRLTSFVGREPEIAALRSELRRARLVTLTGPGGSGKTRLAEEAAAGLPQAWLVELAPLDRPEAVPGAVVGALGLRETALLTNDLTGRQNDPVALLVEHCAPRRLLLILDNCEHVVDAAATLAETLLTRCPELTILATSREPLGVPGESVRPVEPLPPEQARRLFAERAAAVRPDAQAVLRDTEAVAEICRRLDGLPLAIELAAARLRLLTPRQIADRLDDRFRLLTSGSRTVLPRQQTLRAVVDWSWELLDERERTALRELSVFAGGWDLAAAEAVCTGPAADLLGALVDKSLVVATPDDRGAPDDRDDRGGPDDRGAPDDRGGCDGMRYRMLETVHEYAVERAAETPRLRAAAERRHRAWVRALAEETDRRLRGPDQLVWIARMEKELDNVRAALHRAVTAGEEAEAAALTLAMSWFWWLRNHRREGAAWADRVLRLGVALDTAGDLPGPGTDRPHPVEAFLSAPDGERTHPLHEQRMDLRLSRLFLLSESTQPKDIVEHPRHREYIDRIRLHYAEGGPRAARLPGMLWPLTAYFLRDTWDVRPFLDAAVANCRRYGDDWAQAVTLMFRTHMAVDSPGGVHGIDGDLAELRRLGARVGDRWLRAQVCSAVGEAAMARSLFAQARTEYEEALRLAHEVGAHTETPYLLARLAEIDYRSGDLDAARAGLCRAGAAADRYSVVDSRAYVRLMGALIALEEQRTAQARELYDAAQATTRDATPPPQFLAMLTLADGLITAAEAGPREALPKLAAALREAVDARCVETVTAGFVDAAARQLAGLGDAARALRLLAASDHWRGGLPRPLPDRTEAERTRTAVRAALPEEQYDREYARGAALAAQDVLAELAEALRTRTGRPAV
ncbi:BTAD domain-containing putative transcriptional regulator [Streptomyces echinoruber]|uniref:AfsR/SARP family transcriptional regulator n=1 Tax=Streptomyces echinoruber TaxID=68898 RepID=UPI00167C70E9|nr:BTAD domain-containing putative transcriptional regulator [Streptomyces echinoruber]